MKVIASLFMLFTLLLCNSIKAQDIHWSQFNQNPLNQNPANAGNFNGTYRFIGNLRNQWRSITIPYSTFSFSAEKKLDEIPGLGVGLQVFNDNVGDGSFQTTEVIGNVSIKKSIAGFEVRPGIGLGINQRRFDPSKFTFDNQFDGIDFNAALPTGETLGTDQKTNFTVGAGLTFRKEINKNESISGGVAVFNINAPNHGFYNQKVRRDQRINVNVRYSRKLNRELILFPSAQVNSQGKYTEIIPGADLRYVLLDKLGQYQALQGGIWYRFGDAAYLTFGGFWKTLFVGVSYDINISKLTPASRARGGIEFAVRYILDIYKPQKKLHRICPEFI